MSRSKDMFDAAIELAAAASEEARAERAQSEARVHMLKAAHSLEQAGNVDEAQRILDEVNRMRGEES